MYWFRWQIESCSRNFIPIRFICCSSSLTAALCIFVSIIENVTMIRIQRELNPGAKTRTMPPSWPRFSAIPVNLLRQIHSVHIFNHHGYVARGHCLASTFQRIERKMVVRWHCVVVMEFFTHCPVISHSSVMWNEFLNDQKVRNECTYFGLAQHIGKPIPTNNIENRCLLHTYAFCRSHGRVTSNCKVTSL